MLRIKYEDWTNDVSDNSSEILRFHNTSNVFVIPIVWILKYSKYIE